MKVSYPELVGSLTCPLRERFRRYDPHRPAELTEKLRLVMDHYHYRTWDGKRPSFEWLRHRWQKGWFGEIKPSHIIFGEEAELADEATQGIRILEGFYRLANENPSIPLAIGWPYEIKLGTCTLTHRVDLVREVKIGRQKHVELVVYRFKETLPDKWLLAHDLEISLAAYAFRAAFEAKEAFISVWYLGRGKVLRTKREAPELARAIKTASRMAAALKDPYPSHGSWCGTCEYRNLCDEWR